jgi:hypothetical protein
MIISKCVQNTDAEYKVLQAVKKMTNLQICVMNNVKFENSHMW